MSPERKIELKDKRLSAIASSPFKGLGCDEQIEISAKKEPFTAGQKDQIIRQIAHNSMRGA